MNKLNIGIIVITILLVVGGVFFFSKESKPSPLAQSIPQDAYLYFWGDGCPHCKNVADFLETWDKKDKINLQKFEVWYNRDNAKLMQEKSKACELKPNEMGVPLMITPDGKCLIGDVPIIDIFKKIQ